jgi:hypothetical protein
MARNTLALEDATIEPAGDAAARRSQNATAAAENVHDLADLVPLVRERLNLDSAFPDDAVLASLMTIAARASPQERWRAAFDSNLGQWLGLKSLDLNGALNTLVGLLASPAMSPSPPSFPRIPPRG